MQFAEIINEIARKNAVSPDAVLADMTAALHVAMEEPRFKEVFGERELSVEEFVSRVAQMVKAQDMARKKANQK